MERLRVKLNAQIYDEASAWFIECRAGDLDEAARCEFDKWLRKSPEHLSAYLELAAIWSDGPALDPELKWSADLLIAEAKTDPENVVTFPASSGVLGFEGSVPGTQSRASAEPGRSDSAASEKPPPAAPPPRPVRKRAVRVFALVASLGAVVLLGALGAYLARSAGVYSTAVGEQRSIQLEDGSTVSMNSKSRIRVRYSKSARAVDLFGGQALFHVAKDGTRPFIVSADGTRVRAVGTQFDVYQRREGTVVTVLEGTVAVAPPAAERVQLPGSGSAQTQATADAITVTAGEQLTVTSNNAHKSEHPDLAAATAWTQRQIIFESATLSEVAEEFNRYNDRQLIVEDPGLLTFHVSGIFSSTDPESLLSFLRARPDVKVTQDGSNIRISKNL
jgi:transmembrane sensor